MRGWRDVYVKELREFARDKRVLYSALIGPLLLEVFLIFVFGFLITTLGDKERKEKVLVYNITQGKPILEVLRASGAFEIEQLSDIRQKDELLKDGKAKLVLEFPDNFTKLYEQRLNPDFIAWYDGNEATGEIALNKLTSIVAKHKDQVREVRLREMKIEPSQLEAYRVRTEKAETGKPFAGAILISFLPYLIVIWAFYGGFSIVSDLVAGEKERGTLETLLVSPISRTAIAFGKFMSLATLSLVSCTSALMGVVIMGVMQFNITKAIFESGLHLSALSVLALVLSLLPLVVFFSGILLALSTYARNQREVQGYLSLASFVVLIPAIVSQFIGYTEAANAKWISFIPVLNVATVIREALLDKVNLYNLVATASFSTVLAVLGLWYAIRLFSRESVLLRV